MKTFECICKRTFDSMNSLHGHCAKCEQYINEKAEIADKHLTEKFLRWWFEKRKETANYLSKIMSSKYGEMIRFGAGFIIKRAKSFGINTNGFECYENCKRLKTQRSGKNNTLARGNKGYLSRQEHLAEEGITNVFQREDVKRKIVDTMKSKYGVTHPYQLPNYHRNCGAESKTHLKVLDYLKGAGFECVSELKGYPKDYFKAYNPELQREFKPRPDIFIPSEKFVVEVFGTLYHADPRKFKDDDVITKWGGTSRQSRYMSMTLLENGILRHWDTEF